MAVESTGGALHFDADIDNRKYLAKILAMESRIDQFVNKTLKANEKIEKSFSKMADGIGGGKLNQGLASAENKLLSFQQAGTKATATVSQSFDALGNNISNGRFSQGMNDAKTRLAGLGRVAANGNNAAGQSFRNLATTASQSTNEIEKDFFNLGNVIKSYLTLQAGQTFVSELIKVRSEFENLDVSFTTILKSKEKADKLMAEVVEFAATTPFQLTDVAKSTKQLLAYGVAAGDIKDELTTLGNIAAGVSQPIGEVAYLYGTLKTQGRAYAMDIRQFTGRGIPIIKELATVLGVAEKNVMGLVEEGKVGFPEVQKAFQNMTGAGGAFFDLMQKQSLTTGGKLSNLKDNIDVMLNSFGEANSGIINSSIDGLGFLVANYKNVLDTLTLLVAAYGTYRAALILTAFFEKNSFTTVMIHNGSRMVEVVRKLTAAQTLQAIGSGLAAKAQAALNAVMLANPVIAYSAAIIALGVILYSLTQANNTASEAQQRFNDIQANATIQVETQKQKINEYISIAKDKNASLDQQAKAIKKLNDLNPEFLGGLTQANISTAEGSRLIQLYLDDLNKKALGELAYAEKQDNLRKIIELRSKGAGSIGNAELFGSAAKNVVSNIFSGTIGKDATKLLVDEKITALENANKTIDSKYGGLIREYQLKGLEVPKTGPGVKQLRTESFVKAKIKELEELRDKTALSSKEYRNYTQQIDKLNEELRNALGKTTTAQNQAQSARETALSALSKAEDKATKKSLSDSEEKIKQAEIEAKELRRLANKAKLGPGVFNRIDAVEKKNIGTVRYDIETENLLKSVQKQQDIFERFEDYKKQVSESAAEERFAFEKGEFDSFQAYLSAQIDPLANKLRAGGLTGGESDRYKKLIETQNAFSTKTKAQQDKDFADAINATTTLEDEISKIRIKYANMAVALGRKNTNERAAEMLAARDKEINAATDEAYKKTKIYQDLNREIIELTKTQARAQIEVIENILKTAKDLSPEVTEELKKQLEYAKQVTASGTNGAYIAELQKRKAAIENIIATQKLSNEQLKDYKKTLQEINGEISAGTGSKGFAKGVAKVGAAMGEIGDSVRSLAGALEETNPELAYTLDTLGSLAKVGSDAAGAFTSFASGDIVGGITKTIGAVVGLFSIGSKVRAMNKKAREEVQKFYDDAAAGEREYQALLRDRERKLVQLNAIGLSGIDNQSKALKKQKSQIDKDYADTLAQLQAQNEGQITGSTYKHGTWLRKAKTTYSYAGLQGMNFDQLEQLYSQNKLTDGAKALFEQLRKLKEEGADVEEQLKLAADAAKELATGTTAESLTSNIISSLRSGKTGLKDVMDDYTKIIQEALLSTFESDVVAVEMKAFYERLAALALSDGELTEDEIKAAQADYLAIRKGIDDKYKQLEKITGVSLTDPNGNTQNQNGITASIKSLTEDTGYAIEGLMRGIYDIIKRNALSNDQNAINLTKQLDLMAQSVGYQLEIRDNTAAIAVHTADQLAAMGIMTTKLESIITNTKPGITPRGSGVATI